MGAEFLTTEKNSFRVLGKRGGGGGGGREGGKRV